MGTDRATETTGSKWLLRSLLCAAVKVFFPDVERAEWINRIIKQAWPYANKYLDQAIFRDLMIPMIRSTAPALADFAFEKLDLGEIVTLTSVERPRSLSSLLLAPENRRCQGVLGQRARSDHDGHRSFVGVACRSLPMASQSNVFRLAMQAMPSSKPN